MMSALKIAPAPPKLVMPAPPRPVMTMVPLAPSLQPEAGNALPIGAQAETRESAPSQQQALTVPSADAVHAPASSSVSAPVLQQQPAQAASNHRAVSSAAATQPRPAAVSAQLTAADLLTRLIVVARRLLQAGAKATS